VDCVDARLNNSQRSSTKIVVCNCEQSLFPFTCTIRHCANLRLDLSQNQEARNEEDHVPQSAFQQLDLQ
jgi:hypothetical protein